MNVHVPVDPLGDRFGMWLFLLTELVLFGALFVVYAVYFHTYHDEFRKASGHLDLRFGTINTVILLISSFTVAASITALKRGNRKLSVGLCLFSTGVGVVFLINKFIEWSHKFEVGLFPGSEILEKEGHGFNLFYGLYYATAGLHALHVIIGGTLLVIAAIMVAKGKVKQDSPTLLENCGLYWHLVDLVWIFVFPLYYLVS